MTSMGLKASDTAPPRSTSRLGTRGSTTVASTGSGRLRLRSGWSQIFTQLATGAAASRKRALRRRGSVPRIGVLRQLPPR